MTAHDGWCPYTCPACADDWDRVMGQNTPKSGSPGGQTATNTPTSVSEGKG